MTKMEETELSGEDIDTTTTVCHLVNKTENNGLVRSVASYNDTKTTDVPSMMKCASCHRVILDKYYLHVDNKCWHESCVQCSVCGIVLSNSCFSKNCKLYCKEDYERLRKQCRGCTQSLGENERVIILDSFSYHVKCFACDFCMRQLQRGDQYLILREEKEVISCKQCYDNERKNAYDSGSDQSLREDDVFSPNAPPRVIHPAGHYLPHHTSPLSGFNPSLHHRHLSSSDKNTQGGMHSMSADSKRSKRPRTILTTAQRRKFKASFEISQKPCRKVRETLAAETGLSPRVVQVWFQNQRAKIVQMKKIARRQNQGDGSERGRGRGRKMKDGDSDSENDCSSPGSYSDTPTPHLYNDMYTSPGSVMQASPSHKQDSNITGEFLSPPTQHSGVDSLYDDFCPTSMSTSPYLSPHAGALTSGHSTVTLQNLDQGPVPLSGSSHSSLMIGFDGPMNVDDSDMTMSSFLSGRVPSANMRPTNDMSTPMDELIHMQSNFFRT